jgi:catechol 2,3-dioxygenase-like lactoylglutathione lyase family enzyme
MTPLFTLKSSNTILYCQQWAETVDFYRHTLRLPVTFETDWFVEFQLAEAVRLSVADETRATIKSSHGAGVTLTFQVEDADIVWRRLRRHGLTLEPVKNHAWGARLFYFSDPEGHRLEIWSETQK